VRPAGASRVSGFTGRGQAGAAALHENPEIRSIEGQKSAHKHTADEIEAALGELSAKGLFIDTWCETVGEAEYYLKMAEKWSKE